MKGCYYCGTYNECNCEAKEEIVEADFIEVEECESCLSSGIELTIYKYVDAQMCNLCARTPISLSITYPTRELSNNEIGKTICYVGNEILKAIKDFKGA